MSILSKSFHQTVKKENWRWLGGISGFVTVAAFFQQYFKISKWQYLLVLVGSMLTIFFLFFLFYLIRNVYSWIHDMRVESVWGEIVKVLAEVYSYIHEIERKKEITERDIADVLSNFCNKVKILFDKKTSSDCSVSIKVPISHYSDSGEWQSIQVKNLSRDQSHISERDTTDYKNAVHDIVGNTAYSYIVSLVIKESSKPHAYLDNNVKANANYITTSGRAIIPYESELVVPIFPSRYKNLSDVYFGGFLCIDSNQKNAFDSEHYDIPMTIGLADGLYSIMLRLIESSNNEDENQ